MKQTGKIEDKYTRKVEHIPAMDASIVPRSRRIGPPSRPRRVLSTFSDSLRLRSRFVALREALSRVPTALRLLARSWSPVSLGSLAAFLAAARQPPRRRSSLARTLEPPSPVTGSSVFPRSFDATPLLTDT